MCQVLLMFGRARSTSPPPTRQTQDRRACFPSARGSQPDGRCGARNGRRAAATASTVGSSGCGSTRLAGAAHVSSMAALPLAEQSGRGAAVAPSGVKRQCPPRTMRPLSTRRVRAAPAQALPMQIDRCGRRGVPNFPDPTLSLPAGNVSGNVSVIDVAGIYFALPPGLDFQSPAVKLARTACGTGRGPLYSRIAVFAGGDLTRHQRAPARSRRRPTRPESSPARSPSAEVLHESSSPASASAPPIAEAAAWSAGSSSGRGEV
jgi:hypothetical protein